MFNRAKYIVLALALVAVLVSGCSTQAAAPSQQPDMATNPPTTPTPTPIPTPSTPTEQPSNPLPNRVDVIYFHRPQRCVTCLCFEERIRYVVATYFQDQLDSGKLTFGVYNIGDSKNAAIVKKYKPVTSSFYINTFKDGTDSIKNWEEIWSWGCRSNKPGFDQKVKSAIEQALASVE